MAITYFGKNENGSDVHSATTYTYSNDNSNIVYTCPGSGSQEVKELGVRVYSESTGYIRLAIYDASLDLVCQGSAQIDVESLVSGGSAWVSHTSFVDFSGDPTTPILTGGTAYVFALTCSATCNIWKDDVTSGWMKYDSDDGLDGFLETLSQDSSNTREYCWRCGVEPYSAGGENIVPLIMQQFRRRK